MLWLPCAFAATWPDLQTPAALESAQPSDAAVVIGIEDYLILPDVPGARANADAWYDWFTVTQGFAIDRVRLIRDSEAARETIEEAIRSEASHVQPGGRLWVVFVGHGSPALDGSDGWLVGADAQPNPKSLETRSLPRQRMLELAGEVPVVAVLDACFSGRSPTGEMLVPGLQPVIPGWAIPAPLPSATILAAAAADQVAGPLPGAGRPAFSYLLLGALRGWGDTDGDGFVTGDEAVQYTQQAMRALIADREQTPTVDGTLAALRTSGREAGPDLRALVRDGPSLAATATAATSGASDSQRDRLDEILRLRNTPNGQRQLEEDGNTAYPGAGYRGIVAGRSTLPDILELRAINTGADCWLDGPKLNKPVPCRDLPARKMGLATSLVMPDFHAYAPKGVVEFIELPPIDHSTPVTVRPSSVKTVDGVHVGTSRDEALAMLGPATSVDSLSARWEDLGLQLLFDGDDRVRVLRIYAVEAVPTAR